MKFHKWKLLLAALCAFGGIRLMTSWIWTSPSGVDTEQKSVGAEVGRYRPTRVGLSEEGLVIPDDEVKDQEGQIGMMIVTTTTTATTTAADATTTTTPTTTPVATTTTTATTTKTTTTTTKRAKTTTTTRKPTTQTRPKTKTKLSSEISGRKLNLTKDVDVIINFSFLPDDDFSFQSLRRKLFDMRQKFKPDVPNFKMFSLNTTISERIHVDREVKDFRSHRCPMSFYKPQQINEKLSKVSIIIPFHNEAWSMLLRTLHSIFNRTPLDLIGEVVLVDDASTFDTLRGPLVDYVKLLPKVKLLRTKTRQGLIRARLLGAKAAKEPTLVFLDAHVECGVDWLEPLLEVILKEPSTIAVPTIDAIYTRTLDYAPFPVPSQGVFTWTLDFTWKHIPQDWFTKHSSIDPIPTATTIGCAMVVNKDYFFHLGGYDEGLFIWGGENLEISFRAWMCGGAVKIVPCSRVGHVFRSRLPYSVPDPDAIGKNLQRVAELWMGPYKKYYYLTTGSKFDFKPSELEILKERRRLHEKLKCRGFKWYLETMAPDVMIPPFGTILFGQAKAVGSSKCITYDVQKKRLTLKECGDFTQLQMFAYVQSRQIVFGEDLCMAMVGKDSLTLEECNHLEANQLWSYDPLVPNEIELKRTGLDRQRPAGAFRLKAFNYKSCLSVSNYDDWQGLSVTDCSYTKVDTYWIFTHKIHQPV